MRPMRYVILGLGLCGLLVALSAQTPVVVDGLKRTRPEFLAAQLDEISWNPQHSALLLQHPGDTLSDAAALAFRQNLLNLPQVREVTIKTDGAPDTLRITLREAQTISPLFGFGGVRGNVHFLLGVADQHLFGLGHELQAFYQNNAGEHNYLVAYKNPTVRGTRFGISVDSRRYAADEPVYFNRGVANYQYVNQSFGAGTSYRLANRHYVEAGATAFRETFNLLDTELEPGIAPVSLRQNKLLLKLGHHLDGRDFIYERVAGLDFRTVAELVLNREDDPFLTAWHELRYYRLVGRRGNFATRLRLGLASNRDSPFAPFVLDSQVNIRGSGNRIDRGTAQFVLNTEYRHRVWSDRKNNFRAQAVTFSDLGTWRSPGGAFRELTDGSTLQHFVGGGVRLTSARARNAVLRVDYGVDWRSPIIRGLVVGFGQYF